MKPQNFVLLIAALLLSGPAMRAADFGWMDDFNIMAEADPSGFRVRLGARFKIGDAQINAVISNCDRPADAYVALRYGELSGRPIEQVLEQYHKAKGKGWGKGWGVIARRLGIKPGSAEFKALKRSDDFYSDADRRTAKEKSKGPEKVKEVDKDQNKGPEADRDPGHDRGKGKGKGTH